MEGLSDAPYLSIVVPVYNEERRLPESLDRILAYLEAKPYHAEVIIADDGSTDNTAAIVEELMGAHANLQLLRLDHRGKGYAVRKGMLAASGQYILFSDADLAVPIEEWEKIERLLVDGYDVVIGSREGLGARRQGEPRYRHLMGRVFNMIVGAVAIAGIRDTQCGFKAFRRRAARDVFSRMQLYKDDARTLQGPAVTAFDVEVLFIARRRGYSIHETPVMWRYGTESKVDPIKDSFRNLRDVLQVRWNAVRGLYPGLTARQQPLEEPARGG
jgi:dolichyl-phosphate beta-glucosyltransferase